MDNREKIISTLNIVRRLPPSKISQNVNAVTHLLPDLADEILQKIDQPLEIGNDTKEGRPFLLSEFNRDGDSHRSPYSNEYYPPLSEGLTPSASLRELEKKANGMFDEYRKLYFEGGLCNVYCWDKEDGNFACVVLVKKDIDKVKGVEQGTWDSINVVDITSEKAKRTATFKITSSVVLEMSIRNPEVGDVNLSGNLTKHREEVVKIEGPEDDAFYLSKIGELVEDMESTMRTALDTIYVGKTQEIVDNVRFEEGSKELAETQKKLRADLFATLHK